jgi:hypothetical protein
MVPLPFARIAAMTKLSPAPAAALGPVAAFLAAITGEELDPDALRATVGKAEHLSAPVLAALAEVASGEELDEDGARLVFFGVHVLAAV